MPMRPVPFPPRLPFHTQGGVCENSLKRGVDKRLAPTPLRVNSLGKGQ